MKITRLSIVLRVIASVVCTYLTLDTLHMIILFLLPGVTPLKLLVSLVLFTVNGIFCLLIVVIIMLIESMSEV